MSADGLDVDMDVHIANDVRSMFPRQPAPRGGFTYLLRDSLTPSASPRWRWLRSRRARVRLWWRRHWWPARIRDLEAALEMYQEWET